MKRSLVVGALASLCCCNDKPPFAEANYARILETPPPQPAGLLLGSPLGITSKLDPDVRVKIAGFQPLAPIGWPMKRPNFEGLVAQIVGTQPVKTTESPFRAMSLGLDVLVINKTDIPAGGILDGIAQPSPTSVAILEVSTFHGWYAIEFSVDSAQVNAPDPQLAEDVVTARNLGELDRTVFSYVLPNSALELLAIEGQSVRSLSASHLGLAANDEIDALNLHMGLYHTNLTEFPTVLTRPVPKTPTVYFTLRQEFLAVNGMAAAVSAHWANGLAANSGTIYKSKWDANVERWATPSVYRSWEQIGVETPVGVIDGLAIDTQMTPEENDDEILFSLTDTLAHQVPAEWQVQMKSADPAHVSTPPRRVVVRVTGGYGSLGAQLKVGRGLGDFCTADPWAKKEVKMTEFETAILPDDFFIARRFENDAAGGTAPLLAVSGFRQHVNDTPVMTGCLSWPRPTDTTGSITIEWGKTDDLTDSPPVFVWEPAITMTYMGQPLTVQHDLPDDGYLPPPPDSLKSAFCLRWKLQQNGTTWYSPIAALRY